MYCRKCGTKLNDSAKFCESCGEVVKTIKQRTDVEKHQQKCLEQDIQKQKNKTKREEKLLALKNPYVIPALGTALIAFALGIFPWPASWGIGTSIWMRAIILLIALLSDYHCTKSRQVNRLYDIKYRYQVKPTTVKIATALSSLTTVVALFALFMI